MRTSVLILIIKFLGLDMYSLAVNIYKLSQLKEEESFRPTLIKSASLCSSSVEVRISQL